MSFTRNIAFLAMAIIVASCGTCKWRPSTDTSHRDSTAINWIDSLRIRDSLAINYVDVPVPIPAENSSSILPGNHTSHLETSLAESDAWVDSTGLHHTLSNKKGTMTATVPVKEHTKETEHIQSGQNYQEKEDSKSEKEYIEVEKPLSAWTQFRLKAFWWLVAMVIISLVYIFRKPLLKLAKIWMPSL